MKGELEINNGDTLVFYKVNYPFEILFWKIIVHSLLFCNFIWRLFTRQDLHHSWMCAISDILSILLSREMAAAFTVRVRNGIEPGVAEFVTLKFE